MRSNFTAYLMYLRQARFSGVGPDWSHWDYPCPQFVKAVEEMLRRGWARRRWLFWGPVGITDRGLEALASGEHKTVKV